MILALLACTKPGPGDCEGASRLEGPVPLEYRLHDGRNKPTVVFIPGGPGGTLMDLDRDGLWALPEDQRVLALDTRGFGCNAHDEVDWSEPGLFSTEVIAEDVAAILQAERIKDYVLYGVSYGTLVATTLAADPGRFGLKSPQTVVLEGTFGHPTATAHEGLVAEWVAVRQSLSAPVREALSADPLPLGFDGFVWAAFIGRHLTFGDTTEGHILIDLLETLGTPDEDELRQALEAIGGGLGEPTDTRRAIRESIVCGEMTESSFLTLELVGGELVPDGDECDGIPLDMPCAPAAIDAQVIYLQGSADPATPLAGAEAHFDEQQDALFVQVTGAGHNPLWNSLGLCSQAFWARSSSLDAIEELMPTCDWPTVLERR